LDYAIDGFATGYYGNWREGCFSEWSSRSERELTSQERLAVEAARRMAQEHYAAEKQRKQGEAAKEAAEILASLPLAAKHPYLDRKKAKPYGLYADGDALVVPLRNTSGEVRSLQRIYPNGDKRFMSGGQISGCYHLIGSALTEPTYVVEGYATGATIHQVTGKSVVVAFNAGNLGPVIKALRDANNAGPLVIAADNDRKTAGNPGVTAARKVADSGYLGVSVVVPEFTGSDGTDFNDLMAAEGEGAVRRFLGLDATKQDLLFSIEGLDVRAPSWLIKGALPREGMGVLFGPSGGGKSFVALDMALCVASGTDWHGRQVKKPGGVIYVCGEGQQGVINRIRAWEKHHGIQVDGLPLRVTRAPVRFLDAQSVADLAASIERHRDALGELSLVQIDTLNRNFGDGDENTTRDMTRFIDAVTDMQKVLGCNVLIVHHTGLSDGDRARGSSSLRAALDYEIQHRVVESGDAKTIALVGKKMKDGAEMEECHFELTYVALGEDEDGEEFGSCVIRATASDKVDAARTADTLMAGERQKIVLRALRDLRAQALEEDPTKSPVIVTQKALYQAMKDRGISEKKTTEMKDDALGKKLIFPAGNRCFVISEDVEKQ